MSAIAGIDPCHLPSGGSIPEWGCAPILADGSGISLLEAKGMAFESAERQCKGVGHHRSSPWKAEVHNGTYLVEAEFECN